MARPWTPANIRRRWPRRRTLTLLGLYDLEIAQQLEHMRKQIAELKANGHGRDEKQVTQLAAELATLTTTANLTPQELADLDRC